MSERMDRLREPEPREDEPEQDGDPWVVISIEDYYDLLMEQQEQM